MKFSIAATFALASTAYSALIPSRGLCYKCQGFTITASGGVNGVLGQLGDGQNRVYGNFPTGKYSLDCAGGIYDSQGRGCILTPPTTQFQCDKGAQPTTGFTIGANGQIYHGGSGTFYACPTGDQGSYNVYTAPVKGQSKCVTITLTANGCSGPPPPPPPKTCPAALTPGYEFPHLIIPVNSQSPNQCYGTQYFGQVTPTISSLFNFDIPTSDNGKTCSLVFLFPTQAQLQTSSFTFSGAGDIDFAKLSSPATSATTYNTRPGVAQDYGVKKVAPGNSYNIATFPCPAGQKIGFSMSSSDTNFRYFQDYNPSPIGLYITTC